VSAAGVSQQSGFRPPAYPYDRLAPLQQAAEQLPGGLVDLSIGTPFDPPPDAVVAALGSSGRERGYPLSVGTPAYREAAVGWLDRRFGVAVPASQAAACVGTKELVAGLPHWLHLRTPDRDTVLYPAISYPSYAMGATLAGCRSVAVPMDDQWRLDLSAIDEADAARALCLWVNTPGNPAGGLDDLGAAAAWGRAHGVPVLSDECYIEFTWDAGDGTGPRAPVPGEVPGRTILEHGTDGVLAVHSLSKRSNLAGVRAGFYAGEAELVAYLSELRKHAGFMVPGPVQAAAVVAFDDDRHVEEQRARYWARLELMRSVLAGIGVDAPLPGGAFYLWAPAPDGDAWALARFLATEGGALVSPGEFYGEAGAGHVRVAVVQPDERLSLVADRLADRGHGRA
jgi:succinyldiaminopimelate transaminase